jgi:type IV pilus assembly protein PilW
MKKTHKKSQKGFSLIELLIAVALGLLLTAIVSSIYIGNRQATVTQRDLAVVTQNGAFAVDTISRFFRQAGHSPVYGVATGAGDTAPPPDFCSKAETQINYTSSTTRAGGAVEGYDATVPAGKTLIANSDMVVLRFYGSSAQRGGSAADGSIVDCYGKSISGPAPGGGASDVSWIKLYVDNDITTGNPALFCTQQNGGEITTQTQSIVDGVESFQVLYGVGARFDVSGTTPVLLGAGDGAVQYRTLATKYLPASSMTLADWNNVLSIRWGVMVSGDAPNSRGGVDATTDYNILGKGYATSNGAAFDATSASTLAAARRNRLRQVFSTTVELKNAPLYNSQCKPS